MIKDIDFDLVGNLITNLREKNRLTQQEFAKDLGVTKGAVCQWEQGSKIKTENLFDIAKYFNITISELIDGQLLEDDDYFERNYSLDEYEFFYHVDDSNYASVLEYLKRCKNVIKRFMILYKLHLDNKLTSKQNDEYERLLRYFKIDIKYVDSLGINEQIHSIDSVVKALKEHCKIKNNAELDYMLYKIYQLDIKINPLSLLNYEKDERAANEYLELIGKEQRDMLLTGTVNEIVDFEIEDIAYFKRLINAGARCLFTRKRLMSFKNNEICEDTFRQLKGVVENRVIQDRFDFYEKDNHYTSNNNFDTYSWKNYSKDEYEFLIDNETTSMIRDIILIKNSDPKSYYQNLADRDRQFLQK